MKNLYLFLLLSIIGISQSKAAHLMGGEITWECVGQDYIFTLKLYKDCGIASGGTGSPGPSQNIAISGGGHNINTFNLPLVSTNDLTPTCNSYQTNKLTCPGSPSSSGTMLEFIYCDTINLSGTIPSTGWTFSWSSCCRPANLAYGANSNFYLRSKIFPYSPNSNARPCIDNSPDFASKPSHVYCIGYPFTYNNSAYDMDGDSLATKWAAPWSANNTSIPYVPPYTVNNQFPGNPQLNSFSGSIYVNNLGNISAFPTGLVVESWKCNKKVAEVYRDIPIIFSNGCGKLNNGTSNNTSPSFYINNIPVSTTNGYVDTITEGDRICFRITAADYDINPNPNDTNGTFQNVTIEPNGNQFGFPINDSTNCKLPPCATLTHPTTGAYPNLTGISAAEAMFCWQTDCIHTNSDNNCFKKYTTYNFVFKALDDFCPVPGISFLTATIVVKNKTENLDFTTTPLLKCADINLNGFVTLNWDTIKDTLNSFHSYEIYYSKNKTGSYILIDSVTNRLNGTYIDTAVSRNIYPNNFGYYKIKIKYHYKCFSTYSRESNIISPIKLFGYDSGTGVIILNWTPLSTPIPAFSNPYYYLMKENPNSVWNQIDSTKFTFYKDSICNDSANYKVIMKNVGCVSNSSIDTLFSICVNTSINEISNSNFNIYPNPTTSLLNIEHTKGSKPYDIVIYNSLGQTVYKMNNITTSNLQVDTKNFKPGVLFIKISSENEASHFKIIKQ